MVTWRRVMKMLNLSATYKLWRYAYWGENGKREKVDEHYTNYHVLVQSFDGAAGTEINIVHYKNHISRVPAVAVFPADWANEKISEQVWDQDSL